MSAGIKNALVQKWKNREMGWMGRVCCRTHLLAGLFGRWPLLSVFSNRPMGTGKTAIFFSLEPDLGNSRAGPLSSF